MLSKHIEGLLPSRDYFYHHHHEFINSVTPKNRMILFLTKGGCIYKILGRYLILINSIKYNFIHWKIYEGQMTIMNPLFPFPSQVVWLSIRGCIIYFTIFLVSNVDCIQRRADKYPDEIYRGSFQRCPDSRQQHGILVGTQCAQISATTQPAKLIYVPTDRRKVWSKLFMHVHVGRGIGQSRLVLIYLSVTCII